MNRKQRRAQEKLGTRTVAGRPGATPARQAALVAANRLNDMALDLHKAGRNDEALAALRQAIATLPENPLYHNNLGELLRLGGDATGSLPHFERAIILKPNYAEAHSNRGNALRDLKRPQDALACYEAALAARPDYAEALSNQAACLIDLRRFDEAAEILQRAIALNPDIATFHQNLGLALASLQRRAEAESAFANAIRLAPELIDTHLALGDLSRSQGDFDDMLRWYEQACRLRPGHAEAHLRLGTALMVKGDYRAAWPHFGARWQIDTMANDRRPFTLPFWQGQSLRTGAKMLLFTEQGVGETLALLGLLPELLETGIEPVIECDPRMIPLFRRSFPQLEIFARENPPHPRLFNPDLVVQATFFDLAAIFRNSPADCTGALPLRADMDRSAALRARYRNGRDIPLVGVAWYSRNPQIGAPKSAELTDLAPFLCMQGIRFVDLQYGNRAPDRDALKTATGAEILYDPDIDQMKDLDGFAAQVAAMDLVITTSNTTAHMAGALGKPAWVLLHKGISPHWYWGRDGETTPWYPTLRLLRQMQGGDWRGLALRASVELTRQFPAGI